MRAHAQRAFFLLLTVCVLSVCQHKAQGSPEPKLFRVEHGASMQKIAHDLAQQGFISRPWSLLLWARLDPRHHRAIRAGVYPLAPNDSAYAILGILRQGPPSARLTFPEGWTSRQMAPLLEMHNILPAAAFLEKVEKDRLEGYLFPDTYVFEQGSDVDAVVGMMRRRFNQELPADWSAQQKILRLSENQLITLASIVEREARMAQERPIIAGVYLNRLHKHMRLEADPTVQYALKEWKSHLTYKDLETPSPYNTYRHAGLPPGPICNPGAAALNAAAHPAKTNMLFFVAVGDGSHVFTKNYHEHLAVQRKRR